MLFLDFDYENVPQFQKIIPVMDKCLLLVRPQAEAITETYKIIKATRGLNPDLDYYFVYDGFPDDRRGGVLFERFAGMAARRLGVHLVWLGYFHLGDGQRGIFENLNYELLFLNQKGRTESVEKFLLADLVRSGVQAEAKIAV
jgi:hypothetical protein